MSEPELAYMTGTNDDFDLPRWQTQTHHDSLSSSAQTAHAVTQPSYLYAGAPPPPPPPALAAGHRLPPQSNNTTSSRQTRISQLLDQDQQLGINASPYQSTAQSQLARSASLSGASNNNPTTNARNRRHHPPDDLEGAFNSEAQGARQQSHTGVSSNSFYPSSVGYHTQPLAGTSPAVDNSSSPATDSYPDMYYSGTAGHPPKRSQTLHDASSSRSVPSPLRSGNATTTLMDPYSQQAQYSPTTTTTTIPAAYPYGASPDQRTQPPPTSYHPHSRAPSIVKMESMTPPATSPYSTHSGMHSPYSSTYVMESTSPHPGAQSRTHLTPDPPNRQPSASTPSTPLSYTHSSQNSHYFPQDQPMVVEPAQKRRASGLRRVRDWRDLRFRVDNNPVGRRMDSTGVYLSVSVPDRFTEAITIDTLL